MRTTAMRSALLQIATLLVSFPAAAIEWEVWLSDQSNSDNVNQVNPRGTFGSRILIYDGRDITVAEARADSNLPTGRVDGEYVN
ncbi:MAG: hypothetical protein F4X59_09580 [Holophagales bacterium]|nr:hypothetical protein [Holophagales bacterium]MXW02345.1 hypothetical protein [Holophagales bacterium]MYC10365.1 hypothetical protein [Holophagales bacterium]